MTELRLQVDSKLRTANPRSDMDRLELVNHISNVLRGMPVILLSVEWLASDRCRVCWHGSDGHPPQTTFVDPTS